MAKNRLADFIRKNLGPILAAWEEFARTIEPPALTMTDEELRDHAREMLLVFASDLDTAQTDQERSDKSMGLGERRREDTAAETHAEARLLSGYSVVQLVSEYRALRSSVLTLWGKEAIDDPVTNMADTTRFNEAVDQALAESVARYQELVNKSQNMFLAILGHDLRNPLSTLVTGSDLIMHATDMPPKQVLVATRMFHSAKRMSRLIDDLVDFTRTHLGRAIPIRVTEGDLVATCGQVVSELRTAHPARHIELEVPPRLDAFFDDDRIAQVLSNLIGNALQYGRKAIPVKICLTSSADELFITVNNHGPTIPADEIANIFDPLVRLASGSENRDSDSKSLGIGLFISREIVRAHGGHVSVASDDVDGTTFAVTLPRWAGRSQATGPR
jgi:signal transduction histidine kinase